MTVLDEKYPQPQCQKTVSMGDLSSHPHWRGRVSGIPDSHFKQPIPSALRGASATKQSRLSPRRDIWIASLALAMTKRRHISAFSQHTSRPSFCEKHTLGNFGGRREDRVPAAPMASRATKSTRVVTTGTAETARPSLRNGFNGCSVLSSVSRRSSHRHRRDAQASSPTWHQPWGARTTRLHRPRAPSFVS